MKKLEGVLLIFSLMISESQSAVAIKGWTTFSSYAPVTSSFASFMVEAGDMIVVSGSGNNQEIRTESNLALGGTAGLAWTDSGSLLSGGASLQFWYGTATVGGTVTLN